MAFGASGNALLAILSSSHPTLFCQYGDESEVQFVQLAAIVIIPDSRCQSGTDCRPNTAYLLVFVLYGTLYSFPSYDGATAIFPVIKGVTYTVTEGATWLALMDWRSCLVY